MHIARKIVVFFLLISLSISLCARTDSSIVSDNQPLEDTANSLRSILHEIQAFSSKDPNAYLQKCYEGIQLAEKENNDSIKAEIMLVAAKINYTKGQFQKGLEILLEVEKISKQREDEILRAKSLLNQGNIHWFSKSYNEALKYYQKANEIGINEANNEIKGWALNNIGLIYEYLELYDSALIYLVKAQEIRIQEKDTAHIYSGYYNIGAVYQSMGKYDLANNYMLKAIEQDGRYIPIVEYGHYLVHIGNGYANRHDYKNAEYYLLKGIEKCEEVNSIYSLEKGYSYLADVYEKQNKLAKALHFQKKSGILKDTLYSKQMSEELTKLKLDFEAEKKEKEIQVLRLEKELTEKEAKRKGFQGKIYLAISILLGIILVLVYRQISAHKSFNSKLQHQVNSKTAELKTATDKAIRANNLKTEFLKNMSHEVRTPLNAIHGFSSLLSEMLPYEEESHSYLKTISSSSDILLDIFNNILELSQLENGEVIIEKTDLDLTEFFRTIIAKYKPITEESSAGKITLEILPINEQKPLLIKTDERRLKQAFSKLIENAIKFTEAGHIKTGVSIHPNSVILFVEDSGIGIDKDQQDEIFDKFTKLEPNNKKLYGGPGLGLTICKLIIDKLDGKIWLESAAGKGSTFYIELPLTT